MLKLLIIALLVGCVHTGGKNRWTLSDTALEAGFVGATAYVWSKTDDMQWVCSETNPLLDRCGKAGSGLSPTLYFTTLLVTHAVSSYLMPKRYRRVFQGVTLGIQARTAYFNSTYEKTSDWTELRQWCADHPDDKLNCKGDF